MPAPQTQYLFPGDKVTTDFSSRCKGMVFTITQVAPRVSQTGFMCLTEPEVPGAVDPGIPGDEPWIDQAWFRKVETPQNPLFGE